MINKISNGKQIVLIMNYLIRLIIFIIILNSNIAYAISENKILFKINNKIYSTVDLEERKKYLKLKNEKENINIDAILKDLISINLFYENFNQNIINEKNILDIYDNYFSKYEDYNNQTIFKNIFEDLGKEKIINNLTKDFVRKNILQNELNKNKNQILEKNDNQINEIYNINLAYFSFDNENFILLQKNIDINNIDNLELFNTFLKKNKIKYLFQKNTINNFAKINETIKKNILNNKKKFILINNNTNLIGFINKELKMDNNNINLNLVNLVSKNELNKKLLNCDKINSIKNNVVIKNIKDIKFSQLNDQIKNKFKNINDFIQIKNKDNFFIFNIMFR